MDKCGVGSVALVLFLIVLWVHDGLPGLPELSDRALTIGAAVALVLVILFRVALRMDLL